MADREAIIERVRRAARHRATVPDAYAPPPLPGSWETFAASLTGVGGEAHGPWPRHELGRRLAELVRDRAAGGRSVAEPSAAELAGTGPWQVAREPAVGHAFEDVAVAVVRGRVAAADCGAVAVIERAAPHRALPFLCQHLVLLLPDNEMPLAIRSQALGESCEGFLFGLALGGIRDDSRK
ncbi:MAG: hypothetical protein ABFS41_11960, partial [Myxococcota bacterium]